jgi:hypothetical protein
LRGALVVFSRPAIYWQEAVFYVKFFSAGQTMKAMSKPRIALFLSFFAALAFLSDCGSGAQKTVVKRYPEGFSLKHPEGWTVRVVDRQYI